MKQTNNKNNSKNERQGKKSLLYMKCALRQAHEVLNYDRHVILVFFFNRKSIFDWLGLCWRVVINTNYLSHVGTWVNISPKQIQNYFNTLFRNKEWKGRHTWLKCFWTVFRVYPLNTSIGAAHCQHSMCCREKNQEYSGILNHKKIDANPWEINVQVQKGEYSCCLLTSSLQTKAHLCLSLPTDF